MCLLPWFLLCLTSFCSSCAGVADASAIPEYLSEWFQASPPAEATEAWYAANGSKYEWTVGMKNGRPVASRRDPEAEKASALPDVLKHTDGKQDERGEVHAIKVADGWLVAYNAGEWGGSLWWYATDGKQHYKISTDQIVQFLPTQRDVFALEGLRHLSQSRGRIVQLQRNAQGRWISVLFVKLGYAPEVGLVDANGDLLVSTTDSLVQVHPDKTQTVLLLHVFWSYFYPHSIALSPIGDIYLGMRHGVSRVRQVNHKYTADWLLPNSTFLNAEPKF